jgi:hypothetical protein
MRANMAVPTLLPVERAEVIRSARARERVGSCLSEPYWKNATA